MARPRSSNKSAKQRGGQGAAGKRKLGAAPNAGGAVGRPAKQRRREGRSKPADNDVYEAEDSDPDEVKHAERFDQVDNYEYELPSDFEDEEIDEDLAFTEDDKKKFGAWFEKEVSADGDDDDGEEGILGVGDDDGDVWDGEEDDEDEEGDGDDLDDGKGRRRKADADDYDGAADDDDDFDDLFPDDDEGDEDADLDDDEGEDLDEEDEERHRAMLRDVLGADGRKRARRDPNAAVVSEAYPESEYNLNPGAASAGGAAGSLSIADLLQGLTAEERRKLGSSRKLLEKFAASLGSKGGRDKAGLKPVSVPLPTIVAERQERKAGYEAAAQDVTKWQPLVKANREAPTLKLVSNRDVRRVTTTAALVAQHTPSADNALEAEVAALLEAAGAASAEAIEEAEEKLALKALSLEEARERRERLAKLRSLLFYHELKARRLKAIKSKEYHRHLAKAAKRKASKLAAAAAETGGEDGPGDVDAERVAAIEAEFQRAKERLTLRHRNSSRWARRALKRGQLQMDEGTKAALAEQLQLGQQLKRKIEGRKGDGSDSEDGSTSASDGEEEGGDGEDGEGRAAGKGAGRARSAALELLAGGGPLDLTGDAAPKKGLLALPFMKRALERRRLEAQQQAEQMLRDLDEQEILRQQEDEEPGTAGDGGPGGSANGGGLEALVGYGVPVAVESGAAGRRRFGGGAGADNVAAEGDEDGDKDGSDVESDDQEDADAKAERLGKKTRDAKERQKLAHKEHPGKGKGRGGKGQAAATAAPPSAADQAELDAVLAAGAAGRGLLVTSSDAGINHAVPATGTAGSDDDDADAVRRDSGRGASSSRSGVGGSRPAVLAGVAAQQASVRPGGGRAALFEAKAAGAAGKGQAGASDGAAAGPAEEAAGKKFVASKTFTGARPGYFFKRGPQGLGYYLDPKAAAAAATTGPTAGKQQQQQQQRGKGGKGKAGADGAAAATEQEPPPVTVAGREKQAGQGAPEAAGGAADDGAASGRSKKAKRRKGQAAAAAAGDAVSDDDEDAAEEAAAAPMMRPATAAQQRDLIRQAFAGDDVEAEFAAEKAAAVAEELPNIEEPSALPGWGAWAGQQRNPKWMQAAKDRAAKQRADAAAGRKDANNKYVVITEKWDKKAAKYSTPAAPFPFTSAEAYERSLRQPLGREYNPDTAFRDLTRPAVLKQAGSVIAPLRYNENVAKELWRKGPKAAREREAKMVMTVSGGMVKTGKK